MCCEGTWAGRSNQACAKEDLGFRGFRGLGFMALGEISKATKNAVSALNPKP